jgi:hypothetical protein
MWLLVVTVLCPDKYLCFEAGGKKAVPTGRQYLTGNGTMLTLQEHYV